MGEKRLYRTHLNRTARIGPSCAPPIVAWSSVGRAREAGDGPAFIPECPCCSADRADLRRLLDTCPGTAAARESRRKNGGAQLSWKQVPQGVADLAELRRRVRLLGRVTATVVAGLRQRRRAARASQKGEEEGDVEEDDPPQEEEPR